MPSLTYRRISILLAIAAAVALLLATRASAGTDPWVPVPVPKPKPRANPWIALWTLRDRNLAESIRIAAATFGVSARWLTSCKNSEGGNTGRETLRRGLVTGYGGWNTAGSYAFGPWQFMLSSKPAPSSREWGTFGSYVHSAFARARARRVIVPFRFKRPDSYVGQSMTAAYMFSIGQAGQWTGGGC